MTLHFWGNPPLSDSDPKLAQLVRVIAEQRNGYLVGKSDGTVVRMIGPRSWRERPRLEQPVVGDWCLESNGAIAELLPRRSLLYRPGPIDRPQLQPLAAEIDRAWILTTAPQPFWPRVDRYTELCKTQNIPFAIVLTKSDLLVSEDEKCLKEAEARGWEAYLVGKQTQTESVEELLSTLALGDTIVLLGPSGVGKSTLTNWLLKAETQTTGEVRSSDGLGRHTTTERRLFRICPGHFLIDSPGLRELRLPGEAESLPACPKPHCRHHTEPGCLVVAAFRRGEISKQELERKRKSPQKS